MEIICEDCGSTFEFSAREQQFYISKGYGLPKRCKSCRDNRKNNNKYDVGFSGLGYKVSSFSNNAQLFGMPADVRGSSVEYKYVIRATKADEVKYISWDEIAKKYKFVNKEALATSHNWDNAVKFRDRIEKKYIDYSFELIKRSYWSQFNDDFFLY